MLFHYLFHTSLPLEGDDREVAQTEFFLSRSSNFLYQTGAFCSLLFYNIFIVEPRLFSAFIAIYATFPYLTRQTDRYLRGLYSSSRAQLLSTPRSKSHNFHFTHRSLPLRPSWQSSARPLSEVETLMGAFHARVIGFSFRFPRVLLSINFFFSLSNNFALE